MHVDDINLLKNLDMLFEKKVVFYGAGRNGKKAMDIVNNISGINVLCFCETDAEGWRYKHQTNHYLGVPVKSMHELKEEVKSEDIVLILTVSHLMNEEIISYITSTWNELETVYTWFGLHFCIELNLSDSRIPQAYREKRLLIRNCKRTVRTSYLESANTYDLLQPNSVLNLQAAKVGSSTVWHSLQARGIDVAHIHFIIGYSEGCIGYHEDIAKLYTWWREHVACKQNIKVICLVRDPIARSISQYMEFFQVDYILVDDVIADIISGVQQYIRKDMSVGKDGYLFDWFDKEIKGLFGIDVYKYPFDREKGYGIIRENNVELLLLTMEKLSENVKVVGDFVGLEDFSFVDSNVGSLKQYAYVYRDVLENIAIEQEVLDFYYKENAGLDHFYNAEHKEKFRKKWIRNMR